MVTPLALHGANSVTIKYVFTLIAPINVIHHHVRASCIYELCSKRYVRSRHYRGAYPSTCPNARSDCCRVGRSAQSLWAHCRRRRSRFDRRLRTDTACHSRFGVGPMLKRFWARICRRCIHCNHPARSHSLHGGYGCTEHYHERVPFLDDRGRKRLQHIQSHKCPCPLSIDEIRVNQ